MTPQPQLERVAQANGRGSTRIENCRGDFDRISALVERSWSENAHRPLFYSAEFLASCFEYPGASLAMAPTIYEGPSPVAFAAALPRRVSLGGRHLNLTVITFLTAASEYKKRGYGIAVWMDLVKRARAAGFHGMVNYTTEGEAMDAAILGCCRMVKFPTARNLTVPYWSRIIQPGSPRSAPPAPAPDLVERFLALAAPIAQRVPLTRLWTEPEAEWQCRGRYGSLVAEVESCGRRGMLVGYVMPVANEARTKCLMIEDVLWGNLEPLEREGLVRTLLDRAAEAGAQLAVVTDLGYADLEPFRAARFRPSGRVQHVHLTVWSGDAFMERLPSMYLDIT